MQLCNTINEYNEKEKPMLKTYKHEQHMHITKLEFISLALYLIAITGIFAGGITVLQAENIITVVVFGGIIFISLLSFLGASVIEKYTNQIKRRNY